MRLRTMIGVHRSANTSAPSATGQYCPYFTPFTLLPRAAVRESDYRTSFRMARAEILTSMTTTQDMWALGDYDRIADLLADMGRAVAAAAEIGPGMRVLDIGSGTGNAALPAAAAGA